MISLSVKQNYEGHNYIVCCNVFGFKSDDQIKSRFYCIKRLNNVLCGSCGWETPNTGHCNITIRHLNFLHKILNPDCKMSQYMDGSFKNYYYQKESTKHAEDIMSETFLFCLAPTRKSMIR